MQISSFIISSSKIFNLVSSFSDLTFQVATVKFSLLKIVLYFLTLLYCFYLLVMFSVFYVKFYGKNGEDFIFNLFGKVLLRLFI